MSRYNLNQQTMSALLVSVLNERHPELNALFNAVKTAQGIEAAATAARKAATEERKAEGLDGDNLFRQTMNAAKSLAFANNGDGNEAGIAGATIMQYWAGRCAAEGLPDNTGKSMARLLALTTEALRLRDVSPEQVDEWTRPDAQEFFASEDAQGRARVKRKVGEMVKGATAEYCRQLDAHIAGFTYTPTQADPLGFIPKKEKAKAKPAPDA